MFKKSKLASAVVVALAATVAVSPSVLAQNAGAVLGTVVKYSPEGQGSSTTIDSAVSLFTLGQDLIVNDEVWLTASAALNAASEFPSTLVTCSLDDDTDNVITLTRYSNTTTLGKYRLTAKTDGTTDGTKKRGCCLRHSSWWTGPNGRRWQHCADVGRSSCSDSCFDNTLDRRC
jgi:hypothetical protein